jgi:translocator protein
MTSLPGAVGGVDGPEARTPSGGRLKSAFAFAGWLALCFSAAAFGGLFGPGEWYAKLNKPAWNPPGWVFALVWSALYTMMAVAAWLVWRRGGLPSRRVPLAFFLSQLLLNALWSPTFFGLRNPGLAFADIALLWSVLVITLVSFWRVRLLAGALLAPYLAWVTFAAALNLAIWRLNP